MVAEFELFQLKNTPFFDTTGQRPTANWFCVCRYIYFQDERKERKNANLRKFTFVFSLMFVFTNNRV